MFNIPKPLVKIFLIISAAAFALPAINNYLYTIALYPDVPFWITLITGGVAFIFFILLSFDLIPLPVSAWLFGIGVVLMLVSAGFSAYVFYDAYSKNALVFAFNADLSSNIINSFNEIKNSVLSSQEGQDSLDVIGAVGDMASQSEGII